MPSPRPPDHLAPAPASRGARWLVEVGPLGAIVALLWVKLVYFSALLPSEWWAQKKPSSSGCRDYLQSVRYFDRAFGGLIDRLRAAGLLESSVIVVYGDHHGFIGDPPDLGDLLGFPAGDEYQTLRARKRLPFEAT